MLHTRREEDEMLKAEMYQLKLKEVIISSLNNDNKKNSRKDRNNSLLSSQRKMKSKQRVTITQHLRQTLLPKFFKRLAFLQILINNLLVKVIMILKVYYKSLTEEVLIKINLSMFHKNSQKIISFSRNKVQLIIYSINIISNRKKNLILAALLKSLTE